MAHIEKVASVLDIGRQSRDTNLDALIGQNKPTRNEVGSPFMFV